MSERRKGARYPKTLSLQLYDENKEMLPGDPFMVDLSMHGLCFEAAAAPSVGALLNFRIHLPKHGFVAGIGRVRWTYPAPGGSKHLTGVQFETFGWVNQQTLKSYLLPHVRKGPREEFE